MRQIDLGNSAVVAILEDAVACGRSLAPAIHCEHGALVEGRREERARFVREMMLDVAPLQPAFLGGFREARLQVMRGAIGKLAARIQYVAQKQRIPDRK